MHREKCGCHTASVKALANPMGSLEAGRPFRIFSHLGQKGQAFIALTSHWMQVTKKGNVEQE